MLSGIEKRFGLPPIEKIVALVSGPTGGKVEKLLSRLEKLAGDPEGLKTAICLLEAVERLDRAGTLDRLIKLLQILGPMTKSQNVKLLIEKFDKMEKILGVLLKEE